VETAFKIARLYWYKQARNKHKIISLQHSYHGAGLGSVAATRARSGDFWEGFAPLASGFIQAPYFYCSRCPFNLKYPSCKILCAHYVEEIIKTEGADSVAAYIAEPVLGAAGNIAPPPEYFPIIREICTNYEVLLIGDEVQTGFGRTGKMWAQEHWNVNWDIMTLQGNPICAAAAKAALKLIIREKLVENAERVGNYVLERLNREFNSLSNVSDVGGAGLMLGIDVVRDKTTKTPFDATTMSKWQREVLQKGLYIRLSVTKDYNRVRFNPPIITTKEEADEMLDILYPAMADLKSR
jgi:taurine-pyruvate aminotransferase